MTRQAPVQHLTDLLVGFWGTQAVYTAVVLGLPDHLSTAQPRRAADVAERIGADAGALERLLEFLVSLEVVDGEPVAGYRLTEAGALLRSDADQPMDAHVRMYGAYFYRCWTSLPYAIRTGASAFDHEFGTGLFPFLADHPDASRDYERMMIGGAPFFAEVDQRFAFSGAERVVDVGGGHGALLAELLARHPTMSGVLFDVPHVIAEHAETHIGPQLATRCERIGGDLFQGVPPGGDVYILSRILHCFEDEACRTILEHCRRGITPGGRLLILERVMADGSRSALTPGFNLHMLAVLGGGRERDAAAFGKLLASGGFELVERTSLSLGVHMLVAAPV